MVIIVGFRLCSRRQLYQDYEDDAGTIVISRFLDFTENTLCKVQSCSFRKTHKSVTQRGRTLAMLAVKQIGNP